MERPVITLFARENGLQVKQVNKAGRTLSLTGPVSSTREAMKKKHSRIILIFLPTKAPELNLIEVRWWMQRMAINNSIFENESDIGEAVSDWSKNYNKTQ
jgi:hypothetical protein